MIKINVICGGQSDEREISLKSGKVIAGALTEAGFNVEMLDTDDDIEQITNCDVVFPVLHGVGGEDGQFQKLLEDSGVEFIGSGSKVSALCMDKAAYRDTVIEAGFLMAKGDTISLGQLESHPLLFKPFVVKPIDGGSSIDTHIVRDIDSYNFDLIHQSLVKHQTMIIEELIEGIEVTAGVLGNTSLPLVEIIPPNDTEFDFENKYNGKTIELCPPENVSAEDQTAVQDIALRLHKFLGCKDFSRSDFIITKDHEYYLLETNTIPGMTKASLFPKAAQAAGYPMSKWTSMLVKKHLIN